MQNWCISKFFPDFHLFLVAVENAALKYMEILTEANMLKVGRERKCIGEKKVIKAKVENKNIEWISFHGRKNETMTRKGYRI